MGILSSLSLLIVVLLITLLWGNYVTNRIPKTGREGISKGIEVSAVITNTNKAADRAVTLKATGNGRNFKVKMKPTEAHLWIKGDTVKVLISEENPKKYRILFNDYFKENESRIHNYAVSLTEKFKHNRLSSRFLKLSPESLNSFKSAEHMNSQRIFTFVSLMNLIDQYCIFAAVFLIFFMVYYSMNKFSLGKLLIPAIIFGLIVWYISFAVKICTKILSEAEKK